MPGRRDVLKFLNEDKRAQLGQLFAPVLGRKLRIEVDSGADAADRARATSPSQDEPGDADDDDARMTPRQALGLPLVKQVMDVFDADLIDVRPDPAGHQPDHEAETAGNDLADDETENDQEG